MDLLVISIAALAAFAPASPPASSLVVEAASIHAQRSPGGAVASATITVRIVSGSAAIGAGLAPPRPNMASRRATTPAADGSPVAALIYDFE